MEPSPDNSKKQLGTAGLAQPAIWQEVYEPETCLSQYYPRNTVFFYGFPAGEDSQFFNGVPPWIEELVAARPLVCAGGGMKVVTFHSTSGERTLRLLEQVCGVDLLKPQNILVLPKEIDKNLRGNVRNEMVKKSLEEMTGDKNLIMAQPFLTPSLSSHFQIAPELTNWLNDKATMSKYIPTEFLPRRHLSFKNGIEFAAFTGVLPLPCVVKLSSSSSGDGVRICRTQEDVAQAQKTFGDLHGTVFIEEYIEAKHNFGIQFGISHDTTRKIEIIGFNEQVIDKCGGFLGGIVRATSNIPAMKAIHAALLDKILPAVRALGWYGIGGIDVLVTQDDKIYFIDPNFRQTAIFALVCKSRNQKMTKSIISLTGSFTGTEEEFAKNVLVTAKEKTPDQLMTMVSLSQDGDRYSFNAGLLFDSEESMKENAKALLKTGVTAAILNKIAVA
ncbi:MAG: ATP-grasp domain-containing protein [Patescibacteria group bacterium]